ncbi:MAG: hypothetical protein Q4G04_04160 [bacterium]|nr:hypothetical protein [bacterium]
MKKILLIILLLLVTFFIYKTTNKSNYNYTTIGDNLNIFNWNNKYNYNDYLKDYLTNNNLLNNYNGDFARSTFHITDIINFINNNKKIKDLTINQILNKTDILTISIGSNELYYQLDNVKNPTIYIDNILQDMNILFNRIDKYNYKQVFILGYYCTNELYQEDINYTNNILKNISNKYKFTFINTDEIYQKMAKSTSDFLDFNHLTSFHQQISQIIIDNLRNN